MTLLSVMVMLLFASLKICADSWEKGEAKINQVNKMAVVYNFFQRHLAVAKPLWNESNPNERSFAFQGKEQALQFVSAFPASAKRAGLQLFTIALDQKDGQAVIKVKIVPFFNSAKNKQWREEEVILIKRVSQFNLNYFGSEDGASDAMWLSEWLDKDRQPDLVKINMSIINDETETVDDVLFFPEMIIPIRMIVDNSGVEAIQADESVDESNSDDNNTETVQ
jgi:general secretion pathway protein J